MEKAQYPNGGGDGRIYRTRVVFAHTVKCQVAKLDLLVVRGRSMLNIASIYWSNWIN